MKTDIPIKQQIMDLLDQLSADDQGRVLSFARNLRDTPHDERGLPYFTPQELIGFFSQFSFTQEEKDEMQRIMEEIGQ